MGEYAGHVVSTVMLVGVVIMVTYVYVRYKKMAYDKEHPDLDRDTLAGTHYFV